MGLGYAYAGLAAFQVASGLQQSEMMVRQGELNQAIAEMNAKYTEQEAWEAEQYGYSLTARYKANEDAVISQQRSTFESQGVDTTVGTAREVIEETKLTGYLNTLEIQKQARKKALGLNFQASNMRLGGDTAALQSVVNAGQARTQGLLQAANTGLTGYYRSQS